MASSTMPKWQELPYEILALIFPYLKPFQHDLFAASLVCRNWYSFAVGNLWHTPQFNSVGSFDVFEKCLRAQPDACRVVREFHLKHYKGHLFPYATIQKIVSQLPSLTSIQLPLFNRVDGAGPTAECLFSLTQSKPSLRRLHFSCEENNTQLITAPEKFFSFMRNCSHLTELSFQAPMYQPSDPIITSTLPERVAEFSRTLSPMESLKTLELNGAIVRMTLFTLFLPLAPNLQSLSINHNGIQEDFIGKIASISPQLQSLKLSSKDVYSISQLIEDIAYYFPKLHHFDLSLASIHPNQADDQSLSKFFEINSGALRSLRLERTGLNIHGLASLGRYVSKNLEQLKLHESFHSHDGQLIVALEDILKRCGGSLRILDLRDVTAPLEARIGELIAQYCPNLEELSLGAHNFSEASLLSIIQQCAARLRKLSLIGGSGITSNVVQIITDKCHLIHDLRIPASPRRSRKQPPLDSKVLIPLIQQHGARLTHLNVKYWTISNDILNTIGTHCARSLRVLRIERNDSIMRPVLLKTLKSCLNLVSVDLLETTSSWTLPGLIEMEAERRSILDDNCWYN